MANELDSAHHLYVVPYKDVRNRTTVEHEQQSKAKAPPPPAQAGHVIEIDSSAVVAVPPGASGLSSLFDRDADPGPRAERPRVLDAGDALKKDLPVKKKDGQAAITLNAGTGAELAAALQHRLRIKQQLVPGDSGPGDPAATAPADDPGSGNIAENNLTVKANNVNKPVKQRAGTPTGRRPSWTGAPAGRRPSWTGASVSTMTTGDPPANVSANNSISTGGTLEWGDYQNLSEEEQEVQAVFFAQRFQVREDVVIHPLKDLSFLFRLADIFRPRPSGGYASRGRARTSIGEGRL